MWAHLLLLLTGSVLFTLSAHTSNDPHFTDQQLIHHFHAQLITDASGLAASRKHRGVLYTHNDSEHPTNYVFAINASSAALISTLMIFPSSNFDWEDIAVGPCGSTSCIYIADTGSTGRTDVYRVEEPDFIYSDQILQNARKLTYTWTGVPSNHLTSRTIMVDPHGNVYLVNDRVRDIGLISPDMWNKPQPVDIATPYLLNFPSDRNHTTDPESGDISPDGTQVLILTYNHIYYWHIRPGNILSSLQGVPIIVPRLPDHHLGGVCWDLDGRNYYTVKEGKNAPLYIHRRIN